MSTKRAGKHPDFKLSSTSIPDPDLKTKTILKPILHYVYAIWISENCTCLSLLELNLHEASWWEIKQVNPFPWEINPTIQLLSTFSLLCSSLKKYYDFLQEV